MDAGMVPLHLAYNINPEDKIAVTVVLWELLPKSNSTYI